MILISWSFSVFSIFASSFSRVWPTSTFPGSRSTFVMSTTVMVMSMVIFSISSAALFSRVISVWPWSRSIFGLFVDQFLDFGNLGEFAVAWAARSGRSALGVNGRRTRRRTLLDCRSSFSSCFFQDIDFLDQFRIRSRLGRIQLQQFHRNCFNVNCLKTVSL